MITWLFEEDSFSPIAKIKNNKHFSIVNDHLGTPIEGYDDKGDLVWERQLNANGKVITQKGIENFCPFLYQGQSLDNEIELAYNRFRYYDIEDGRYISQDPIGLLSGEFGFYNYVEDPLTWLDIFGLHGNSYSSTNKNHVYVIYNKHTGEVHKFGISGGRVRRDGKSSRAESQARKLGPDYKTKIIAKDLSRTKAAKIEQGRVNSYSVAAQRNGTTGIRRTQGVCYSRKTRQNFHII